MPNLVDFCTFLPLVIPGIKTFTFPLLLGGGFVSPYITLDSLVMYTLPKISISLASLAPENRPNPERNLMLPTIHFSGAFCI